MWAYANKVEEIKTQYKQQLAGEEVAMDVWIGVVTTVFLNSQSDRLLPGVYDSTACTEFRCQFRVVGAMTTREKCVERANTIAKSIEDNSKQLATPSLTYYNCHQWVIDQ